MKLKVTRGIECGERGCGDESGHCRVRGEWDGGVECGSNRVKLGQIEVDGGDESDCESGECGDGCGDGDAEKTNLSAFLHPPLHPPLHPLPNQSKPIVPTPLFLSYNFSLYSYNFSLYSYNF